MRSLSSTLLLSSLLLASSAGCSGGDGGPEPRQLLPVSTEPNFVLYVSNQSFDLDPVDIEVRLDGELALEGDFLVEGQHSWHTFDFDLAPGTHELRAVTLAGETVAVEEIEIADGTRYGVLNFWYYESGEAYGPSFGFDLFSEPPAFD
jgi:hypothetical protein